VLHELKLRISHNFTSLLDLGSGPGTVLFAAIQELEGLQSILCFEKDAALIQLAKDLARFSQAKNVSWQNGDLAKPIFPPHDLVVISYALNELNNKEEVVAKAWEATQSALVIIEPGTMPGFAVIRAARQQLIDSGASIAAPCPHNKLCPMPDNDWCHFSERVERTSLHRKLKSGTLGYEDEKYSYVIATKVPAVPCNARVLRHTQKHSGHLQVELCAPEGLVRKTISKRDGELYKQARKWEWGDGV
jgi:ribosomal protein RSM22 (predicted rRNA methylase)